MSPSLFRRKKIRAGLTVGGQLRAARQRMRLTLGEAEAATRVRVKYLDALEADRFDDLPEDVYTRGFLVRYAEFLGLNAREVTADYRGACWTAHRLGQTAVSRRPESIVPMRPLREPRIILTPKLVWITASFVFVLAVAGYVWWQVSGFVAAPPLEVASPTPEMIVSSPSITIEGRTEGHAVVTINAEPVAIDPEGRFAQEVHLTSGLNTIEIAARNRLNKETKKQLRVVTTY